MSSSLGYVSDPKFDHLKKVRLIFVGNVAVTYSHEVWILSFEVGGHAGLPNNGVLPHL